MCLIRVFLSLCLILGFTSSVEAGGALEELRKNFALKRHAGLYFKETTDSNQELLEILSFNLMNNGGCVISFLGIAVDPIYFNEGSDPQDLDYGNGISAVQCEWRITAVDGDRADVEINYAQFVRDPDSLFFPGGECAEVGCIAIGIERGRIEDGVYDYNETTVFVDLEFNNISSLFGDFIASEGLRLRQVDVDEVRGLLDNVSAPHPMVPGGELP